MSPSASLPEVNTYASDTGAKYVLLAGWYGAANLGDELLLEVIAGWVRQAGAVPIAISLNPGFTLETIGIEAVGYTDLPAIVDAMLRSQVFVLGGGGLFQDYNIFDTASLARFPALNVAQFAQFFYLGEELGLTTVALAQGLGPLRGHEGRAIAADVLNRAHFVSLRDGASAVLAREIGVKRETTIAADPAWEWGTGSPSEGTLAAEFPALAGKKIIALVLRDWPFLDGWEDAFIEAMRGLIPDTWGCLWLEFDRPASHPASSPASEVARRLIARLDSGTVHAVWEGRTAREASSVLAKCDACVAMRLHGVLLAHAIGLPTVSVEYDGKVATLDADLGVPATQRVPIEAIGSRLRAAMEIIMHDERNAFQLDRGFAQRLACEALQHRDVLLGAMAARRPGVRPAVGQLGRQPWLPRWLAAGGHDAGRIMRCLSNDTASLAPALDDHWRKALSPSR